MVQPTITSDKLQIEILGFDKILALKSRLEVPLNHITDVKTDSSVPDDWWHGLKGWGTEMPFIVAAGTFFHKGKRVFCDFYHPKKVVIISLKDERYHEFIVEVNDPEAFAGELLKACGK
jgi:hypothetical protein